MATVTMVAVITVLNVVIKVPVWAAAIINMVVVDNVSVIDVLAGVAVVTAIVLEFPLLV